MDNLLTKDEGLRVSVGCTCSMCVGHLHCGTSWYARQSVVYLGVSVNV